MTREEIFENRREIGIKICEQIRQNDGQMVNAKNFSERPYYDGEKKYKFSTANYLRLISAENIYVYPTWYKIDDVKKNNWKLKTDAKFELLEEWQSEECLLTKFYNASQILEVEKYPPKNKSLEEILKSLQVRGILGNEKIISFRDGINAVKKYAGNFVDDELTKILTVQMWTAESKLKTNIKKFLPTFSDEILTGIEKNPDKIFESANKAQAILKNLHREKILPTEKTSVKEIFQDLKIIYHGGEIKNKDGFNYQPESILTGVAAYNFLSMLKSSEKQKIWLEFFYGDYAHGKFLISEKDFESLVEESVTDFLKSRLDKNRQELLKNPQMLKKYISPKIMVRTEDIFNQINLESENFQTAMKNFEQEKIRYLQSC